MAVTKPALARKMQRIIVVYNPHSSRFVDVKKEVIDKLSTMKGCMVGKYEIKKIGIEKNIDNLVGILKDEDLVIAAGGDATGVIAANGILKSGKDVTLAVLPYGNFNDLARTLGIQKIEDVFGKKIKKEKFYPLEIVVDGKMFRYATCYTTIGMMAEAVYIYDKPDMRKKLKTRFGRAIISYMALAGWHFTHRHRKKFLPDVCLNGKPQAKRSSDYVALNGKWVARVMKGGEYYRDKTVFKSEVVKLTGFCRLVKWMAKSILKQVPGTTTKGDILEFCQPATVTIQAEGEHRLFQGISKIEIRKSDKYLKVLSLSD